MKKHKLLSFILAFASIAIFCNNSALGNDKKVFKDLNNNHWAYNSLLNLKSEGIISGYPNGDIKADNNIKRSEFSSILSNFSKDNNSFINLSDVSEKDWYYEHVLKTKNYFNLYNSNGEILFEPERYITREEVALSVGKILDEGNIPYSENSNLSDLHSLTPEGKKYVSYLSSKGIISGYQDGSFRGNNPVTRGEAAVIITRAFFESKFSENSPTLKDFLKTAIKL